MAKGRRREREAERGHLLRTEEWTERQDQAGVQVGVSQQVLAPRLQVFRRAGTGASGAGLSAVHLNKEIRQLGL